ncbi:conserved oligomeric Golgi complex subunit 1-like [Lineus longissimus]|uniref:conserved oligomeric Golgi complex subunit 1-like n=1 Tax=Lineus longissimus TaxID=88925 RepID=UPI002B4E9C0B
MADSVKPGMPAQEVDSNILFEKFTVDEIRSIENKTRQDIERKKEDLRQMVGERYRDLIEAADTISDMKTSAENVMQSISRMQGHCKQLKEMKIARSGSDFNKKSQSNVIRKKDECQFYDVATQIKLLLDTPEKVWSAIDTGNYLQATQLYLLARHINTALQLDSQQSAKIHSWFPVLARQWAAISHFRATILQGCKEVLKNADISEQDIANSLCSIMLLEDSTPRQVFTGFLLARTHAVQQLFHPDQHSSSIKTQVCDVVYLICTTVHQIHAVFYTGNDVGDIEHGKHNMLMKTVAKITDKSNPGSVILSGEGGSAWKYLPDSVKDFRPALKNPATSIPHPQLQEKCNQWIKTCNQDVNNGVGKLLGYINSVKGLASIRDALWEQLGRDDQMVSWDKQCQEILCKQIAIWEDFFRPLFFERIKAVLQSQLDSALETMKLNLNKCLTDLAQTREASMMHDQDLSTYIWFEGAGDIPNGSAWIPVHSKTLSEGGGLMMKAKAYTSTIQSICKNFDNKLSGILEDGSYYSTVADKPEPVGSFDRYADNEMVENFLCTACETCIFRLLGFIEKNIYSSSRQLDNSEDLLGNMVIINRVLLCGRLCSALCELSPHLQKCIIGSSDKNKEGAKVFKRQHSKLSKRQQDDPKFVEVKRKLIDQSMTAYSLWSEHISKCLVQQYRLSLMDMSSQAVLFGSTRWDEVQIQEETEDGKTIKSTIRVPMQASWYVHSLLYSICNEVNRVGGHALKRSVILGFMEKVSDGVLAAYETLTESTRVENPEEDTVPLTQNRALQLMFDVKFLSTIFSRKEDTQQNKLFTKQMHCVLDTLENQVDPFDLDVFSPYIQSHINKQSQRCSALYGALTSLDKHGTMASSRMPPASTQEQHNIMPLVSGVPRLTLLPLSTTPRTHGIQPMMLQPKAKVSQPGSIGTDMPNISSEPSEMGHKRSSSYFNKLGNMGTLWFSNIGGGKV